MRQLNLTTILLTFLMCMGVLPLQAQVTIDQSNFPEPAAYIDNYYEIATAEPIIPEGGANMVWDYSGIAHETATITQQEYFDAANDSDFPNARNYRESTLNFTVFEVPFRPYFQVDESGYSQIGGKIEESSFSITALSGGADDVLRFPNQVASFEGGEGKNEYLRFPMNYQDQWTSTATNDVNFELTVAAFGLNQTPGIAIETGTDNVEVIGYGHLIIPMEDGSASDPVEVLLVKSISSLVTNYFLGGAPAPEALLNAFGLVDGEEVIDAPTYAFYTPDFSKVVLNVFASSGYIYRPQGAITAEPAVVINRSDFPMQASFTETLYFDSESSLSVPSEGANQAWDYSFLQGTPSETVYHDATNDEAFPNALNHHLVFSQFQQFRVVSDNYLGLDEDGLYRIGVRVKDRSYSITDISGGADDVLRFPPNETLFNNRHNEVQFPMTYEDKWTTERSIQTNFELSVAAFGLNQVPGFSKQTAIDTYEVIGYGTITIPLEDGSPSAPIEGLMVKESVVMVDSIFLGGAPAPTALLNAFGITQGSTSNRTAYSFYTPGFVSKVLRMDSDGRYYYTPAAAKQPEPNFILNREDFTREAGFVDNSIEALLEGFTLPNEGANQAWDYTALSTKEFVTKEYTDASNHPDFPNALNILPDAGLSFQGLPIPTNYVETVDDEGWGYIGKVVTDITHSISAISGGADDVLRFVGGNYLYDGRINRIEFPLTDLSEWTGSRTELIDFELTVGAFGLNQVPGYIERTHTQTHEAVGYGTLQIPLEDGTPSEPMEVVLLKTEETSIDYYYLGGALAPEALTNAFGVTQGTQLLKTKIHYTFYTPGFHINVMRINVNPDTGEVLSVFYRPQAGESQTAPIAINHNRVCDVPSVGQSQVTVVVTGGVGPYQVSGNFNGEIAENESFTFIMDDNETNYEISVTDSEGNESQVFEDVLPCTKLPVELLFFEGEIMMEGNLLQWTTASELNNQYFTLSYSTNGQNFLPLQRIEGNGTISTANSYEFLHRNAPTGTTYYQLAQTDLDGTTKSLGVIGLKRGETNITSIEVYPVPALQSINVAYTFANSSNNSDTMLYIYDLTGRMVKSQKLLNNSSNKAIQLDIENLNSGSYILQIGNSSQTMTTKFTKL